MSWITKKTDKEGKWITKKDSEKNECITSKKDKEGKWITKKVKKNPHKD